MELTTPFKIKDSAGGSASNGRNRLTQAIYSLRGKPLNSWELDPTRVLSNNELSDLACAVGTGLFTDLQTDEEVETAYTKIRYGKVVVLADSDIDGSHIDCLLLGHFFKHLRPLIERGHIYLGLPPLYRISEKGKYTYLRDDTALADFMKKRAVKLVGNNKSLIALAVNSNKVINQIELIGSTYAYSPYDIGANLKAYVQSGEAKGKTHIEQLTNAIVDMRKKTKCEAVSVSHKTESMAIVSGLDSNNRYFTTIVNDELFEVLQHTYEGLVGILTETVFNTVVFGADLGDNGVFDDIYSAVKGIASIITRGIAITRNKGLGEMQPEELGETTLDIDARTLVRVTINNFDAAGTFIGNMLDSKTVEARRQLIANTVLQSESVDA